jgi:hypothetical protein
MTCPFAKNLTYPDIVRDPRTRWQNAAAVAPLLGHLGMNAFTELMLMHVHCEVGMTYVVQKAVSDELRHADFAKDTSFENLPWPAKTVEFNFQDPELGTILAGNLSRDELRVIADAINVTFVGRMAIPDHEHELIALAHTNDHSGTCLLIHDENTWARLLAGERHDISPAGPLDSRMTGQETESLIDHVLMCFKVMVYSSIPQFKPMQVTRHQLKRGEGKPGVRGRPARPTFRTVYLPHVIRVPDKSATTTTTTTELSGITREFKGRRGHIRWFHSDYFVNKKGTWTYIRPVVVEGVEHEVILVRKP